MHEVVCGIYKITNLCNQKVYIGKSIDILKRWVVHKSLLNENKHYNKHLQNAWNKYGQDSFLFEIIDTDSEDKLDDLEVYYIDFYNSASQEHGYNKTLGGDGSIPTEETRQKLSIAHKGRLGTEESRRKQSLKLSGENNPMYGRKGVLSPVFQRQKSDEEIQKIKDSWTDERRKEQSERVSGLNNPMSGMTGGKNHFAHGVLCVETGHVFESIKEAAEWCGLSTHTNISNVCRGVRKRAGKHPDTGELLHWKYV